jgi:hypothetical protein
LAVSTIISGGQTGVDRGALDAALAAGFACGGWCPAGRAAEDGAIPEKYPLDELKRGGYRQRTIRNVDASDGTVIIYFSAPAAGTELTLLECIRRHKPYQLIDANEISPRRASEMALSFADSHSIAVLNFAGPREGHSPGAHEYAFSTVKLFLEALHKSQT